VLTLGIIAMQMKKSKTKVLKSGATLSVVLGLLLLGSVNVKTDSLGSEGWIALAFQEAAADGNRRVARRTSRRTSRRN
jgi:hypothetical protein